MQLLAHVLELVLKGFQLQIFLWTLRVRCNKLKGGRIEDNYLAVKLQKIYLHR